MGDRASNRHIDVPRGLTTDFARGEHRFDLWISTSYRKVCPSTFAAAHAAKMYDVRLSNLFSTIV